MIDLVELCRGARALAGVAPPDHVGPLVYEAVYAGGYRGRGPIPGRLRIRPPLDRAFAASVNARLPGERWTNGWRVVSVGDRSIVAFDGSLRVTARVGDVRGKLRPGADIEVRAPLLDLGGSPGFLYRRGGATPPLTRCYLNIRPPDAWRIVGPLLEALDQAGLDADAKVAANPSHYFRADCAVVYFSSWAERRALRVIRRFADRDLRLGDVTPALTKRLAPGMAIADEPTDVAAPSHGFWVTDILMRAVAEGGELGSIAASAAALIEATGRDPARPHRRATVTQPGE